MEEHSLQIIELKEEPRIGDLTNRGLYFGYDYLTPLSYTERQFSIYMCEYGNSDRVKPIKINVVLKKGDEEI